MNQGESFGDVSLDHLVEKKHMETMVAVWPTCLVIMNRKQFVKVVSSILKMKAQARIDNLMAMMDEELDDKVRKKYYDEVQELIGQNIPILYLIAANSYAASQEGRIGNLWPSLLRPQMTWNLESLWKVQP